MKEVRCSNCGRIEEVTNNRIPWRPECHSRSCNVATVKWLPVPSDEQISLNDSNPKHNQGAAKLPLHLWPQAATAMGCLGMLEGVLKYGRNNFRGTPVMASIYVAACMRHIAAYFNGEDYEMVEDPDNPGKYIEGKPHLAGALSCLGILVDAEAHGTLIDDRNFTPDQEVNYASLEKYLTPFVGRLQKLYGDRTPKNWTIQDDTTDL